MDSVKVNHVNSLKIQSPSGKREISQNFRFKNFQFQNIVYAIFQGIFDSVKGIFVIFYLDREMNKKLTARSQQSPGNLDTTKPQQNKEINKRE